ncbi:MAG: hypothetical protein P8175_12635 [Deltaproteobacteria bacterium]
MAKQANRKLIGGFVLIAVAIMAASVVIFGSGKFFKEKDEYVLYFEGSVRGLGIGAPVLFLEGLDLKEIQTRINSILASVDRLLKNPDLETGLNDLRGGVQDARHLLNNADAKMDALTDSLNRTAEDVHALIVNVGGHAKNLSRSMQATLTEAQEALKGASEDIHAVSGDARNLLRTLDSQVEPLSAKAQGTLDQAKTALSAVNDLMGDRSDTRQKMNRALEAMDTRQKMNRALEAMAAAAQSANSLMDYLDRHPEALLQGKGGR